MRSSSVRRPSKGGENDFLETPRTNRRNLREKEKLSEDIKAKYIQQLEERNRKLKYEIIKINEMLEQQKEKPVVKKEHRLIPQQTSADVIRKQLDNVYKQIKNYEREIRNLENKQAGGMITDKMSRVEMILKEKTQHLEKLKNQLSLLTKSSLENSKKLKNNAGKEELENTMLKRNEEIKVLREKVRDAQNKEKKKAENAKKQFDYIKKLQRELIQNGIAVDELEELKRNNIFNQIYDKMANGNFDQQASRAVVKSGEKEEPIEDMTLDRFNELKNEIKLYKKLQSDYDKRLQVLEKEKGVEEKQTNSIRSKMEEKDEEINKLQQEIGELKSKIKRVNLKPNYATKGQSMDKKPKEKPKMSPTKLKQPNQTKTVTDQTHIKYDEKGQPTAQGQKFTDRNIIGKTTDCKIIGVKVWAQKSTFSINGIQCIYKIGDKVKEGPEHVNKEAKKNCSEIVMDLPDGDYIKTVSGHLSQGNVIEYLVFISKNSVIGRFGMAKQTQKQFNYDIDEDEIPICMYGSVANTKQNKKEGSIIQNLGFEITRNKALNKDDRYV